MKLQSCSLASINLFLVFIFFFSFYFASESGWKLFYFLWDHPSFARLDITSLSSVGGENLLNYAHYFSHNSRKQFYEEKIWKRFSGLSVWNRTVMHFNGIEMKAVIESVVVCIGIKKILICRLINYFRSLFNYLSCQMCKTKVLVIPLIVYKLNIRINKIIANLISCVLTK